MKIVFSLAALGSFLTICQALPAGAGASSHTTYLYFPVEGNSLPELHSDMVRNGPTANGVRGYGVTSVDPGKRLDIAACKKSGSYHFDVEFLIHLPKATNAAASSLSPRDRGMWMRFTQFVKKHEETHRSIWMVCAADFERRLQAGGAQDCASGQTKVRALWSQMIAECSPKQVAFDNAQRGIVSANPFIRQAAR